MSTSPRKKKGTVGGAPDYKSNPTSMSLTVYDFQGDPIPPRVEGLFDQFSEMTEAWIKANGFTSLVISIDRG